MKMPPPPPPRIETLEQALARIAELERALDEAIDIIVKRDALLESYERRLPPANEPPG